MRLDVEVVAEGAAGEVAARRAAAVVAVAFRVVVEARRAEVAEVAFRLVAAGE